MSYTTLTTLGSIAVGAGLLGWYDRFHLAVGLPMLLLGGGLIALHTRKASLEEGDTNEEDR